MRRSIRRLLGMLLLATLSGPVPAAPSAGGKKDAAPAAPAPIELHVGIPGLVYIGQPLTDLEKKFPAAKVVPFSGQDDAVSIRIAELGISCLAVGTPVDLKVASIGFNLDGDYQGVGEAPYRTTKGIGKGSTVNDVLEAYGQPADVLSEQPRGALRRRPAPDTPSTPKMYQYKNDAGTVMTFFLVQDNLVRRVVVNDLEPLDRHVVKGGAKK